MNAAEGSQHPGRRGAHRKTLEELVRAVAESIEAGRILHRFLDAAALVSDAILRGQAGRHAHHASPAPKGLEFRPRLSVTGWRWHLPTQPLHQRRKRHSRKNAGLVYVGMTRARKSLTSPARSTPHFRQRANRCALPALAFLGEIPSELVDTVRGPMPKSAESRRYEPRSRVFLSSEEFLRRARGTVCAERAHATAAAAPTNSFSRPAIKRGGKDRPAAGPEGAAIRSTAWGTVVGVEGEERRPPHLREFPGAAQKNSSSATPLAAGVAPPQPAMAPVRFNYFGVGGSPRFCGRPARTQN